MPKVSERSFHYRRPTKEALRERANARGGNFDSILKPQYKVYKVRDGKNLIRILPPSWENADYYGVNIFINYDIGADRQSYLSLSKMKNQKDPLAEARQQAERDGDDELAKQLRPTERVLMWVIDRNAEEEGPLLWAAPFSKVAKAFLNLAFDEDDGKVLYIDDPEEGYDVRFYREGTTKTNTNYDASKMKLLGPKPIHDDEDKQADWLDFVRENPIPDCLNFYDYAHISNVFNGGAAAKPEDTEGEEPTPPPRRRAAAPPAEADEPPFDTAESTPAPRTRTRVTAPAEPEDEEVPASRRRPVRAEPEDAEPPRGESIRDRIRRRNQQATADE